MPDFIPRRDAEAVGWSANFTQQVVANYQTFGFSQQDADELAALQGQFATAVQLASAASTRTSASVIGKNTARKAFERKARVMAGILRANPEISQATQIDLSIVIGPGREAPRRKIGPPKSAPVLFVRDVKGSRVTVQLKNVEWPSMRGLAPDLMGATVYAWIGDAPPVRIGEWGYRRGTSTPLLTLDIALPHAPGAKVWLAAQWQNPRSEAGPVSALVFTYLGHQSGTPGQNAA